MKRRNLFKSLAGITLVETLIGTAVTSAVGIAVFAFLDAGTYLSAKNLSLNLTNNQMRGALDRVEQVLQQGDTNPTLIDTSGNAVGSGQAAGVKFDRFIDGPYVADQTTTTSTSTSIKLARSTASLSSTRPAFTDMVGDVIKLDGTATSLRPRIISSGSNPSSTTSGTIETITCPLSAALGTTVKSTTSSVLTAKLVRQVAFIVMQNGSKYELRYYHSYETTTSLSDTTKYTVITDQIATQSADILPFALSTVGGESFVTMTLRVRNGNADNRLLKKQSDEYNTYSRVDSYLRPKVNP